MAAPADDWLVVLRGAGVELRLGNGSLRLQNHSGREVRAGGGALLLVVVVVSGAVRWTVNVLNASALCLFSWVHNQ